MKRISRILTLAQVRARIEQARHKNQARQAQLDKIDTKIHNLEGKRYRLEIKEGPVDHRHALELAEQLGCDAIGVLDHKYTALRKEGKWYSPIYKNNDWDNPKLEEI